MQNHWLRDLFDELSPALVLFARQWCASPDDAVQEAFIDLSNTKTQPDCPKAWLFKTTKRKAQNIARADSRRRKYHRQLQEEETGRGVDRAWFHSSSASELQVDDVAAGLEQLPGEDREVLVARIWGDLKFEPLAELLGCSVSSAHRKYESALIHLKQIMTSADNPTSASGSDS